MGALFKGGKMRGVVTNVYLWKTSEKPKETGQSFYEYLHLFNHKKETSKSGTLIKNRKESKPELHNQ